MSGPFTSKIAGVSMVLAMSAAPMVSASVPRTEHCEIRVVPTPSRELTFSAKPERSISFAATAVSSTTPETLEEIMKTIQTSDRPWSRRLSKLHAVDRVSNKNLVGLVEMLQTSDSSIGLRPESSLVKMAGSGSNGAKDAATPPLRSMIVAACMRTSSISLTTLRPTSSPRVSMMQ